MDIKSPQARSYNMSQIKSKDTKPEEIVRKFLFSKGYRYRKNDKRYPGKPDIVLPKYRCVIFVNGCFWHKHEGCKYFVWPKSNSDFWKAKINANIERDKLNYASLTQQGWNIITIWECQLRPTNRSETLAELDSQLKKILTL